MPSSLNHIVSDPWSVRQALSQIGLTEEIVREVAFAAASARAECLAVDPAGAPGSQSYFSGVRHIRLKLLPEGWEMARDGNVEATINHKLGLQLVFQNVDRACGAADPNAMSAKGAGSRNLVRSGQIELFGSTPSGAPLRGKKPIVWLVCVSVNGDFVRAEVSCPEVFEGNQFEGFSQRIFVIDEQLAPVPSTHRRSDDGGDDHDLDFDVAVTRK